MSFWRNEEAGFAVYTSPGGRYARVSQRYLSIIKEVLYTSGKCRENWDAARANEYSTGKRIRRRGYRRRCRRMCRIAGLHAGRAFLYSPRARRRYPERRQQGKQRDPPHGIRRSTGQSRTRMYQGRLRRIPKNPRATQSSACQEFRPARCMD